MQCPGGLSAREHHQDRDNGNRAPLYIHADEIDILYPMLTNTPGADQALAAKDQFFRNAREHGLPVADAVATFDAAWVLGLMLAFNVGAFSQGWFHAKLALVIALSAYQGWLGSYGRKLAKGVRPVTGRTLRMINEIPGIAAALIVVLVIVRPF